MRAVSVCMISFALSCLIFIPSSVFATEPSFGSYVVPSDNKWYSFNVPGNEEMAVWARYSGGLHGQLSVEVTQFDGTVLASCDRRYLWTFDAEREPGLPRAESMTLRLPVSGRTVSIVLLIQQFVPRRHVRFGLYRRADVPFNEFYVRNRIKRYRGVRDWAKDVHPFRDHLYPPDKSFATLVGDLQPFVCITQYAKEIGQKLDYDALRWRGGLYELRRYYKKRLNMKPEWGYVVIDHKQKRWWKLCAMRLSDDNSRPTAWLFPDGYLAVTNGLCQEFRIFRVLDDDRCVENFVIPTNAIAGHMRAFFRQFRLGEKAELSPIIPTMVCEKPGLKNVLVVEYVVAFDVGVAYRVHYEIYQGRLIDSSVKLLSRRGRVSEKRRQ